MCHEEGTFFKVKSGMELHNQCLFISLKMRWLGPRIVDKLYQQILSRERIVHRLDT